jgi:hypothetical protein
MRNAGLFVVLVFTIAIHAQTPRLELFGGYSFLHQPGNVGLSGWNTAVTWNCYKYLGITADIAGHYRSVSTVVLLPASTTISARTRLHAFTFGPTFALRNRTRVTPFAHALFGVSRMTTAYTSTAPLITSPSLNNYSHNFGGGLDIQVTPHIAVRIAQVDVNVVRFPGGTWQDSRRYSTGVVFMSGNR